MIDDPYDKTIDDIVADYNKPGEVPRDAMWARIEAARSMARATRPQTRRTSKVWVWPGVGIAALLVLSAGIVIGRRMASTDPVRVTATKAADTTPANAGAVVSASTDAPNAIASTTKAAAVATNRSTTPPTTAATPGDADASALAYRLVVLQHLAGTEAAITAFRSAARQGQIDPQVTKWSRDLLNTTRMLRGSSAAADPVMRRLLADLDLVLTQIAAYSAGGQTHTEDLELIEESIIQRGVIAKLRNTNPARAPGGNRGL